MVKRSVSGVEVFEPVAESLARLLHPHAEVVLHDLESGTIVAVFNAFSRRQVGDNSMIDDVVQLGDGPDVHGPHEKRLFDGRRIKYVSSLLRNDTGKAIGLLCVNLDVSLMEQLETVIGAFLGNTRNSSPLDELFEDVRDSDLLRQQILLKKVLFFSERLDLTELVGKDLNDQYAKRGGAASLADAPPPPPLPARPQKRGPPPESGTAP